MKIYEKIANLQEARLQCLKSENKVWEDKHTKSLIDILSKSELSGSGLDSGTTFDYDNSIGEKLIFHSAYHVMNDGGYYTHWINFSVTVTPSLCFNILFSIKGNFGKDQDIKDIIHDRFWEFLMSEI